MMTRNLDLRVEVLAPVNHPKHRAWLDKVLGSLWADDVVAFTLDGSGTWNRTGPAEFGFAHDAQGQLMKWATELQMSHGASSPYDLDENTDSRGIRRPGLLARWFSNPGE